MNHSIGKLASIAFLGRVAGRLFQYASLVVVAQFLGPTALGTYAFALVFLRVGATVARAGLDTAAQKFVPIYSEDGADDRLTGLSLLVVGTPLAVGTVVAGVVLVSLPVVESVFDTASGPVVAVLALGIPLLALVHVTEATTRGFKETKHSVAVRDLAYGGGTVVLVAAVAAGGGDLRAVAVAHVVALAGAVVLGVLLMHRLGAFPTVARPTFETRRVYAYSVTVALLAVTNRVIAWTDVVVLSAFEPLAAVGHYEAAFQTAALLSFALVSVNAIFPAVASELFHSDERRRLERTYASVTKWITFVTAFAGTFAVVFASEILAIFGTSFQAATAVLVVLVVGRVGMAAAGPAGFLLTMSGHERVEMANMVAASLLNLLLNVALVSRYGVAGAAVASSVTILALNAVRVAEVRLLVGFLPYTREFLRGIPALVVAGSAVAAVRATGLPALPAVVVAGFVGGGAFLALAVGLAVDEDDRLLVASIR